MGSPRWQKVWHDVLDHKLRTVLVVISIAVGIAAIGTVTGSHAVISHDLPLAFAQTNPMHARFGISDFDHKLVDAVARTPGVGLAEPRDVTNVQVQTAPERWRTLRLTRVDDFAKMRISILHPVQGAWSPGKGELLVERSSLALLGAQIGDQVLVETADGSQRQLRLVGVVHDLNVISSGFTGQLYGYVASDTWEWLGYGADFGRLTVTVAEQGEDKAHIQAVAAAVREKVERGGYTVFWSFVPEPGEHEFEQFLTPMLLIFGVIGVLSLLLSCFLVVNIISAILAQQVRQIGVMKTVGAGNHQLISMYLLTTLIYSALGLLVAVPLGWLGARANTTFIAGLMNFDVVSQTAPPRVLALEAAVGLLTPLVAALFPILRGVRISVREAISDYGLAQRTGAGWVDRWLERVRGLSRPLLLALRNTFRRKGRLALTVLTLTLASAIFIAVFSVRASLLRTLEDALNYWRYDVSLSFDRPYRVLFLEQEARQAPGVAAAEAWGFWGTHRIRSDGTDGDNLLLIAPPPGSQMIKPILVAGRWLRPEDERGVVINTDALDNEPDLRVGAPLTLDINGRETTWEVVGIVRGVLTGPFVYANYPRFARVTRSVGRAAQVQVKAQHSDPAFQEQVGRALTDHFKAAGVVVTSVETTDSTRQQIQAQFGALITVLSSMALLLAVVGGLGLMGTMSINVLERRREIGVLRAIGASNRALLEIVLAEGMVIGVLSWALGVLVALPMSKLLSDAVGVGFIQAELSYRFSTGGALAWLGVMLLISALASLIPAHSATRLTVREILAYE